MQVVQTKSNPRPSAPIDRITLKIPYCKSTLKCKCSPDVLFSFFFNNHLFLFFTGRLLLFPDQPHVPPDFLLGKGEEGRIDITTLKSLKNWDIRQPRSLLEVVSEMLNIYKDSQKQSVLAFPSERIHFEVSVVQDRPGVEFLLTNSSDYGAEVGIFFFIDQIFTTPLSLSLSHRSDWLYHWISKKQGILPNVVKTNHVCLLRGVRT